MNEPAMNEFSHPTTMRELANWCHNKNIKAEVQKALNEGADLIDRLRGKLQMAKLWMIHDSGCIPHPDNEPGDGCRCGLSFFLSEIKND